MNSDGAYFVEIRSIRQASVDVFIIQDIIFISVDIKFNKNSSGDEIANVNFYAVRPGSYPNSLK